MKECEVNDKQLFVAADDTAEGAKPGVGAFGLPTPFVASQFPSVFIFPILLVAAVSHYQINASLSPSFPQRIRVVAAIGDHSFELLPRATLRRGTWIPLSVASASVTYAGEALSS
jgi:hypothetical protein